MSSSFMSMNPLSIKDQAEYIVIRAKSEDDLVELIAFYRDRRRGDKDKHKVARRVVELAYERLRKEDYENVV